MTIQLLHRFRFFKLVLMAVLGLSGCAQDNSLLEIKSVPPGKAVVVIKTTPGSTTWALAPKKGSTKFGETFRSGVVSSSYEAHVLQPGPYVLQDIVYGSDFISLNPNKMTVFMAEENSLNYVGAYTVVPTSSGAHDYLSSTIRDEQGAALQEIYKKHPQLRNMPVKRNMMQHWIKK